MLGFNYKKAVQSLNFFAQKEKRSSIDKMKAFKLIWLSDREHLRKYGRPILSDKYYAMKWGAVPSSTKDLTEKDSFLDKAEKNYRDSYIKPKERSYQFSSIEKVDYSVFSETDIQTMNNIYTHFGKMSGVDLSEICHEYPEWKQFQVPLEKGEASRFEMDYLDFFKNPENISSDYFASNKEDLSLSQDIYQENIRLCF